jgi:hypothetical protein
MTFSRKTPAMQLVTDPTGLFHLQGCISSWKKYTYVPLNIFTRSMLKFVLIILSKYEGKPMRTRVTKPQ